jgi:hypothetical protein
MSIKMKGVEWNKFYNDDSFWKEGVWYEDLSITVGGFEVEDHDLIDDAAAIKIDGGVIHFDEEATQSISFESAFRKWRKAQKVAYITIEIPNDGNGSVYRECDFLRSVGYKIV